MVDRLPEGRPYVCHGTLVPRKLSKAFNKYLLYEFKKLQDC